MIGEFSLAQVATELGLQPALSQPALSQETLAQAALASCVFSAVSTDSRDVGAGTLFVALEGARFDGNDFVAEVLAAGAVGAITSRGFSAALGVTLQVPDTLAALAAIARLNRRRSEATLIALTGSQGKTSVKEMLGCILREEANTLVTSGNLNNTIGVPQTLLGLEAEARFAVIEMGANGAGEIAFSVAAAEPQIVLITKASAAHIEGFGSLQGIVEAKGEIIEGLGPEGVAVLNANDANCSQWVARAAPRRVCLFSYGERVGSAAYRCSEGRLLANGSVGFRLFTPQGEVEIETQLLGSHNAENALAAAACALEAGASLSAVKRGLELAKPVPGRLFPSIGRAGCRLLDDTYNASPDSYKAAIEVLMSAEGQPVLVAGGMRELGAETEEAHSEVGRYAAERGVPLLLAVGEECRGLLDAYLAAGGTEAQLFAEHESLAAECVRVADASRVFLVKGSRGARMDKIVAALGAIGAARG